jgi:hypothetical protein
MVSVGRGESVVQGRRGPRQGVRQGNCNRSPRVWCACCPSTPGVNALVCAYAGILIARTSTTGAERSARFARTACVGGEASGR